MSGAKVAPVAVAPAVPVVMMATAVAGAALLAGTGLLALGVVAKGVVRLGREVYGKIDDEIEKLAEEEIRKHQEQIERLTRARPEEREQLYEEIVKEEDPIAGVRGAPQAEFLKTLEDVKERRKNKEVERVLRHNSSEYMEQKIEEIRKKSAEKRKKRSAGTPDFDKYRQEIEALCRTIQTVYPEAAAELGNLEGVRENEAVFKKRITRLHKIEERLRENAGMLNSLAKLYIRWKASFAFQMLPEQERERFRSCYERKRSMAETGHAGERDVEELKAILEEQIELGNRAVEKMRFDEHINLLKQALNAKGYDRITEEEEGIYWKITGRKSADGTKAVSFRCLRHTVPDESGPVFRMDIEPTGYLSPAEREKEGRAVFHELECLGFATQTTV